MKIIVTGATGMVGAEVIRESLRYNEITEVVAIVRSDLKINHSKLQIIQHQDFLNYENLKMKFAEADAIIWCLGISQTQVNKKQYEEITFDYTIAAAKTFQEVNHHGKFIFLSGEGADNTEKSRTIFARIKGKTENSLLKMNLQSLFIARPGGIRPIHQNPKAPLAYKIMLPIFPLMEKLFPNKMINSVQLANALLSVAIHGNKLQTLRNEDLKLLAKN
jgi:uncharacterized protein YbjT (DUF2867 family)